MEIIQEENNSSNSSLSLPPPAPNDLFRALIVQYNRPVDRYPILRNLLERGAYFPSSIPECRVLDYLQYDADERTIKLFKDYWPSLIAKGLDLNDEMHNGANNVLFEFRHYPNKIEHALSWGVNPLYKIGPEQLTAREKIQLLIPTTTRPDMMHTLEQSAILLYNAELEQIKKNLKLRETAHNSIRWAQTRNHNISSLRNLTPEIRMDIINRAIPRIQLQPPPP